MSSSDRSIDERCRKQEPRHNNFDEMKIDDTNKKGENIFVSDDLDDGMGLLDNNGPNNTNDILSTNNIGPASQLPPHEKDFVNEGQRNALGKVKQGELGETEDEFLKERNNTHTGDFSDPNLMVPATSSISMGGKRKASFHPFPATGHGLVSEKQHCCGSKKPRSEMPRLRGGGGPFETLSNSLILRSDDINVMVQKKPTIYNPYRKNQESGDGSGLTSNGGQRNEKESDDDYSFDPDEFNHAWDEIDQKLPGVLTSRTGEGERSEKESDDDYSFDPDEFNHAWEEIDQKLPGVLTSRTGEGERSEKESDDDYSFDPDEFNHAWEEIDQKLPGVLTSATGEGETDDRSSDGMDLQEQPAPLNVPKRPPVQKKGGGRRRERTNRSGLFDKFLRDTLDDENLDEDIENRENIVSLEGTPENLMRLASEEEPSPELAASPQILKKSKPARGGRKKSIPVDKPHKKVTAPKKVKKARRKTRQTKSSSIELPPPGSCTWTEIVAQYGCTIDSLTDAVTLVLRFHPSGDIWKGANFSESQYNEGEHSKYVFRKQIWDLLTSDFKKIFFSDGKLQDPKIGKASESVKTWRINISNALRRCRKIVAPAVAIAKGRAGDVQVGDDHVNMVTRVAAMTEQERAQYNEQNRQRMAARVAAMTEQERAQYNEQNRQRMAARVAAMTEQERAQYYEQHRQRCRRWWAALSPEEKRKRRKKYLEQQKKKRRARCKSFVLSDMDGKEVETVIDDLWTKKGPDHLDGVHSLQELIEEEGCALYYGVCGRPALYEVHTEGYRFIVDKNKGNISVIMRDPNYTAEIATTQGDQPYTPRKVDYYGHRTMGLVKLTKQECMDRGIETYILMDNHWRSLENPLKIEQGLQIKIDETDFGTQKLHRTPGAGQPQSNFRKRRGTMAIFVTVLPKDFFANNPDIVIVDERKNSKWRSKAAYEADISSSRTSMVVGGAENDVVEEDPGMNPTIDDYEDPAWGKQQEEISEEECQIEIGCEEIALEEGLLEDEPPL